ncbi:MAG: gliding motility protein GldC [Chitinophagales bacterium]|jgi:gliding motility-associated protein GldC|nr:gliding motility protein GldC [Chitinophagales bacterium]
MRKSTITVDVHLDEDKVPEQINWTATDSTADMMQQAKAMMLAFWDGADKSALRIDLWTKTMMVDEMADFYYQTMMGMADAFERATHNQELVKEMKDFAKEFYNKFREQQLKENA